MHRSTQLLALTALAMGISAAQAETQPPADGADSALAPVIVTTTRQAETVKKSHRTITVVDQESIRTRQAQSTPELLKDAPNISVTGGPRAESQEVNIRGLQGQRVLQLVDGARQVFESGHRPTYLLDPELVKSVEAVRGPASALWGSGALGGVVAYSIVDPQDLMQPGDTMGGFVKGGYNDNTLGKNGSAAVTGRTDNLDWLVSGYYEDHDDVEVAGDRDLENSAARNDGSLAKLVWQIDDRQRLAITGREANSVTGVPANGTAPVNSTSNFLIDRDQQNRNVTLDYTFDHSSDSNTQALAYWNSVEADEARQSDKRGDFTELDVYGLNLSHAFSISRTRILLGADGYQEQFSALRSGDNRPAPPKATSDVWGVFATTDTALTDTLNLELGARFDEFRTEADNLVAQSRRDDAVSPSAALSWQASHWALLTVRHDRAFRAPSAEELYTSGAHFCLGPGFCNTFQPNPNLDPERAANNELIAHMEWANLLGADELTVTASAFQNDVDDFIEQIVTAPVFFPPPADPGITYWTNVEEATLEGFELEAVYRTGNTRLAFGYGQTRGEDDRTGDDLTNIPADTFSADLSHAFFNRQLLAGVRAIHAQRQDNTRYPENTGGTVYSGYTVTDLYASWMPRQAPAVRVDVAINNVNDRDYRRAWDELDAAGRAVVSSIRYQF